MESCMLQPLGMTVPFDDARLSLFHPESTAQQRVSHMIIALHSIPSVSIHLHVFPCYYMMLFSNLCFFLFIKSQVGPAALWREVFSCWFPLVRCCWSCKHLWLKSIWSQCKERVAYFIPCVLTVRKESTSVFWLCRNRKPKSVLLSWCSSLFHAVPSLALCRHKNLREHFSLWSWYLLHLLCF